MLPAVEKTLSPNTLYVVVYYSRTTTCSVQPLALRLRAGVKSPPRRFPDFGTNGNPVRRSRKSGSDGFSANPQRTFRPCRSCPRNCKRRVRCPRVPLGGSSTGKAGIGPGPVSQETCPGLVVLLACGWHMGCGSVAATDSVTRSREPELHVGTNRLSALQAWTSATPT